MSFSAAWLELREPYDRRARNVEVLEAVRAAMAGRASVGVVDLGCGTGATFRALRPLIGGRQSWRLVDNDLGLLARTPRSAPPDVNVATMPVDLHRDLELALDGPIDLIATSALLDLVSDDWLERLAVEAATRHLPLYAALSYDGRIAFDPVDAADRVIVEAVNAHQRTDKGFGPALGPAAAKEAALRFGRLGYRVVQGHSDWAFGPPDRAIQREVLSGWANAARESVPDAEAWLARRQRHVEEGRSSIRVGHLDVFATPTGTR